jgi:hypothetical protein
VPADKLEVGHGLTRITAFTYYRGWRHLSKFH